MSVQHEIAELDARGLRQFGISTGLILAALFGGVFPWLFERDVPIWPWAIAGILCAWALAAPKTLKTVYVLWMKLGLLLSKVTTPIILTLVFLIAFVPPAVIMKIIHRDPMNRKPDKSLNSYRTESHRARPENLKRPF